MRKEVKSLERVDDAEEPMVVGSSVAFVVSLLPLILLVGGGAVAALLVGDPKRDVRRLEKCDDKEDVKRFNDG